MSCLGCPIITQGGRTLYYPMGRGARVVLNYPTGWVGPFNILRVGEQEVSCLSYYITGGRTLIPTGREPRPVLVALL